MIRVRKVTIGGLFIALSVLIPQVFHLLGSAQLGKLLLPMHLPVLLGGFILGPVFGLIVGAAAPLLSTILTGMPAFERLPFMLIELAAYGFISGLAYRTLSFRKRKFGVIISLVIAMFLGRVIYALALFIAADFLHMTGIGASAVLESVITGIFGIIIQLLLIPSLIFVLERSGYYDKVTGEGKKNVT
ncbi:MAG TPA: ECF transporter S component [Ruminococcaceae bacterium]|nr:ECF transporter S component [Oscillospiraceae bacterium]